MLACVLTQGRAFAQLAQADNADPLDPRFREDRRVETDTPLGRFSIGVSGLAEHERLGSTTGDLELGTFYQYELDEMFPRVAELRPFFLNRIESSDTALVESLGLGAGVRLSLREQYELNNWFVRLSIVTPTDYYRERYKLDREQSSVVELFAGFEVPLMPDDRSREIRRRVTGPRLVRLRVAPGLFDLDQPVSSELLEQVHALMIAAYLARVWAIEGAGLDAPTPGGRDWPVLRMIAQVTDVSPTPSQWLTLTTRFDDDPAERVEQRRAVAGDLLRRGLTAMMRGRYPLLIEPGQPVADMRPVGGQAGPRPIGLLSRPGMGPSGGDGRFDADAMIDNYIAQAIAGTD